MIKFFLSIIDLFFSEMHRRNDRLKKARHYLDKILNRNEEEFEFIIAYDARLMVREDRLPEARSRIEECLEKFSESEDDDGKYISLYCQFWLSIFNSTGKAVEIRSEALRLEADSLTKAVLRFPSEEKLAQIISG
ncbi:hypothetical protein GCM10009096_15720 [Parasphingorhabdus litoris]|uniref:Tetratricopeptide repeat protein n=1 Tax=Parasphingorhabdus litoris TaxID=394733 RepID=A0ABN1AF55_9SPHN|nr:hypothetical protein [Parasphingorhabdus litoris]